MNRVLARQLKTNVCGSKHIFQRAWSTHVTRKVSSTAGSNESNANSTGDSPQHDIAIVGGGMVGIALAASLASKPLTKHLNVAIIDNNPLLGRKNIIEKGHLPDPRVSTVTPATISFLKDIGAWKYIEEQRHAYFDKMQVWDYTGLGYTRYNAKDVDQDILGCEPSRANDSNNTMCESVKKKVRVQEYFLEFVKVDDTSGLGLFEKLLDSLKSLTLDVGNVRGQGYDNGSNMKGKHQGVQKRFLDINPNALYMPCACHSLNLVVSDMAHSCVKAISFFGILQLKSLCNTRWENQIKSVKAIRFQAPQVRPALLELYESCDDAMTKSDDESLILSLKILNSYLAWSFAQNIAHDMDVDPVFPNVDLNDFYSELRILQTTLPDVPMEPSEVLEFVENIGAWKYIEEQRHAYFDKMQVWDYTGLGYTRYNAKDVDQDILGCVVENKVLQSSQLSCVQESDLQKTIYPARLNSMDMLPSSSLTGLGEVPSTADLFMRGRLAKLELSDGNNVYAKLVVGADGSKSRVRELAGIKTTGWNYSQNAIICTVEHTVENFTAWQRFLPNGPIALLPVGDKFSNIVWTMDPTEASDRRSMSEDDFIKAVNDALDYGYGPHPEITSSGGSSLSWLTGDVNISAKERFETPPKVVKLSSERMMFPLSLRHAKDYVSNRVALVGDSAHTVHPLAGQGVNLGFADASALSRAIAEGIALGTDIGEANLLKRYEAERKPANIAMMAVLDGIQKMYAVNFGPLNAFRAAAFHGAHYISPLKKRIISYASGEQSLPLFS
uniref:Ubiquinone biosynthesis monooxygenase COQ6, mitochondrial n=1 Tax=Brassica oleracea var. oleracea TaxID=109376 RepID=A0A0D3D586_BRAOL